jgi:hypothetical protein
MMDPDGEDGPIREEMEKSQHLESCDPHHSDEHPDPEYQKNKAEIEFLYVHSMSGAAV